MIQSVSKPSLPVEEQKKQAWEGFSGHYVLPSVVLDAEVIVAKEMYPLLSVKW